MRITSVGRSFPPHRADRDTLAAVCAGVWGDGSPERERVEQLHRSAAVESRWLALPADAYGDLGGFTATNDAFVRIGMDLGERAVRDALDRAGLAPRDVDALWFASVTGIAVPSIDARLLHRVGFRPDLKRVPIFGLGCVAGAAGVARAADYLRGFPDHVAALLCVELCSLTLQRRDRSVANMVATALFGDGAACVVMTGAERGERGPRIVATRSHLYPDSEDVMGWRIGSEGFRIVLSNGVPDMVRRYLRHDVDGFLADHGLARADIGAWIAHPGGPKVIDAMEETLELPDGALEPTRRSLREIGNLSSASVLHVLADTLEQPPGTWGVLLAMGPGFCAELVLLRW